MREYIRLIRKQPGTDYGVSFPDFDGVVTASVSFDDAPAMAAEALALHIDGLLADGEAIPEPSSLETVMSDPHNCDAVAILAVRTQAIKRAMREEP